MTRNGMMNRRSEREQIGGSAELTEKGHLYEDKPIVEHFWARRGDWA